MFLTFRQTNRPTLQSLPPVKRLCYRPVLSVCLCVCLSLSSTVNLMQTTIFQRISELYYTCTCAYTLLYNYRALSFVLHDSDNMSSFYSKISTVILRRMLPDNHLKLATSVFPLPWWCWWWCGLLLQMELHGRSVCVSVYVSVCLSVCWSRSRAPQKRLNRSICQRGVIGLHWFSCYFVNEMKVAGKKNNPQTLLHAHSGHQTVRI